MKSSRSSITLGCFSPTVILLTFLVESGLALYTWWRYKASPFRRRAIIFLALLALFQGSEFLICQGASPEVWARVGFIATAFLPVLGIDFICLLRKKRFYTELGYAVAAAFSMVMVFYPGVFRATVCTGKFVAFYTDAPAFDIAYAAYYLTMLFLGIMLAWQGLKEKKANQKALAWLIVGYASFMLPTFALYAFVVITRVGFASVLCGFAVLMALILVIRILPHVLSERKQSS